MFGWKKKPQPKPQENDTFSGGELSNDELEMVVGGLSSVDVVAEMREKIDRIEYSKRNRGLFSKNGF